MSDPQTITEKRQRAAYDALGLDPELYSRTAEIVISPWKVEVIRYRHENGRKYIDPETGSPAVDVLELLLADPAPPALPPDVADSADPLPPG